MKQALTIVGIVMAFLFVSIVEAWPPKAELTIDKSGKVSTYAPLSKVEKSTLKFANKLFGNTEQREAMAAEAKSFYNKNVSKFATSEDPITLSNTNPGDFEDLRAYLQEFGTWRLVSPNIKTENFFRSLAEATNRKVVVVSN